MRKSTHDDARREIEGALGVLSYNISVFRREPMKENLEHVSLSFKRFNMAIRAYRKTTSDVVRKARRVK